MYYNTITLSLADFINGKDRNPYDENAEINVSLNENTPTTTITEEYITETIPYISLKTEIKKIPKSIKEAPSISISQSNSVTEHVINVSTDKKWDHIY